MTKKTTTLFHTDVFRSINCLTRKETTTMRMKSVLTRALVLSIAMLGALAAAPMAYAQITNHSGVFCTYSNTSEEIFIEHLTNGIRNSKTSATSVICPLTRNASNSNGAYVYVDVTHTGTQTISCYANSYNYDGTLIARVPSGNKTFSGFQEIVLNLSGAGKSNAWSDYSVSCFIAGNSNATIHGVDLSEQ
jgi:hypothetical protein